jgi:hypothetical protein
MKTAPVAGAAVLLLASVAQAGGGHFTAEIVDLTAKGGDEFVITLKQYGEPYSPQREFKPRVLKVHLRHNSGHVLTSKSKYLAALNVLIRQFAKGGQFHLGILGRGYLPIPGKPGEYQSNALAVLEEDPGKFVVYSFAK